MWCGGRIYFMVCFIVGFVIVFGVYVILVFVFVKLILRFVILIFIDSYKLCVIYY